MTHIREMRDSEGEFSPWQATKRMCPRCHQPQVQMRVWESKDGAFEDDQYKCSACGYSWWVDGIDS